MHFTKIITTVDAHTAGEPVRVVTSGLPKIRGNTMIDKMKWFETNLSSVRSLLMREPRGHTNMFGAVLTPPVTEDGDVGVLYMHTTGQATMCGHLTIGVVKVILETGIVTPFEGKNIVRIDAPAGRIDAMAIVRDGIVTNVSFQNVPSFLYTDDIEVDVPDIGKVKVTVSYGGDFYIFVKARDLDIRVMPEYANDIDRFAIWLKKWGNSELNVAHPEIPEINEIYGVIFTDDMVTTSTGNLSSIETASCHPGAIDRSPCGTGTCARMALLHHNGVMSLSQHLESYSIIGTKFVGTIDGLTYVGGKQAIIPRVSGQAWITGFNQFVLEPEDPLQEGFLI
ncbi:MAG: proline racemase family protein [Synergistaceae bacterium]|nr:proline racemase family protein [Synergistaceae bacterium]